MQPQLSRLATLLRPVGRMGRRAYGLGLIGLVLGCALVVNLGQPGLFLGLVLVWVFLCLSARRLHDIGVAGRLALAPVAAFVAVVVAWFYLGLVTKGFCQGYCSGARDEDISALNWVEDHGMAAVGYIWLGFIALLLVLPGRRRTDSDPVEPALSA